MKKSFKLLSAALIALASFVPSQAETILINDGTDTNQYSPIDGYDFDVTDLRVQTIYPEAQVAQMAGTFQRFMLLLSRLNPDGWHFHHVDEVLHC